MAFQETGHFGDKPAFVAKLKGMSRLTQDRGFTYHIRESRKPLLLVDKPGRKLPENNLEFFLKTLSALGESLDRFLTVSKSFDVGDVSASLDGKKKLFGCPPVPPVEYLSFDQSVKRDIELYRVKLATVEFEPSTLGNILRIEDVPMPVWVSVTACPYEKLCHQAKLPDRLLETAPPAQTSGLQKTPRRSLRRHFAEPVCQRNESITFSTLDRSKRLLTSGPSFRTGDCFSKDSFSGLR